MIKVYTKNVTGLIYKTMLQDRVRDRIIPAHRCKIRKDSMAQSHYSTWYPGIRVSGISQVQVFYSTGTLGIVVKKTTLRFSGVEK